MENISVVSGGTTNTALSTPHRPSPLLETLSQTHILNERRSSQTQRRRREAAERGRRSNSNSKSPHVVDIGDLTQDEISRNRLTRNHKISVKDIFLNRKQQFSFSSIYQVLQ